MNRRMRAGRALVLLIDDGSPLTTFAPTTLKHRGHAVWVCTSRESARALLKWGRPSLVLSGPMYGREGPDEWLMELWQLVDPEVPIVLWTGTDYHVWSEKPAREAQPAGRSRLQQLFDVVDRILA